MESKIISKLKRSGIHKYSRNNKAKIYYKTIWKYVTYNNF